MNGQYIHDHLTTRKMLAPGRPIESYLNKEQGQKSDLNEYKIANEKA